MKLMTDDGFEIKVDDRMRVAVRYLGKVKTEQEIKWMSLVDARELMAIQKTLKVPEYELADNRAIPEPKRWAVERAKRESVERNAELMGVLKSKERGVE